MPLILTDQQNLKSLLTPADVEANRRGQITPAQIARLKQEPMFSVGLAVLIVILAGYTLMVFLGLIFGKFGSLSLLLLLILLLGCAIGTAIFSYKRRKTFIQKDLAGKMIEQTEGQLAFGWLEYQIHLPNRRVMIGRDRSGLLPGVTYRFYYLSRTGFILSAEPLAPPDEEQVKESLLKILARVNRFSLRSLDANRQGRLTGRQIFPWLPNLLTALVLFLGAGYLGFRIYQIQFASYPEPAMRPSYLLEAFVFAVIAPFPLILAGIVTTFKGLKPLERGDLVWPHLARLARPILGLSSFLLGGYLLWQIYDIFNYLGPEIGAALRSKSVIFESIWVLLILLGTGWGIHSIAAELWAWQVVSVEGIGRSRSVTETHTSKDKNGSTHTTTTTTYYYHIGQQSFRVSGRAYTALIDGLRYRLYYLPRSRAMVNIEPLSIQPEK